MIVMIGKYFSRITLMAIFLRFLVCPISIEGQHRYALVIGNDNYPGNALQNARNDARSIYQALQEIGYTSSLALDTNRSELSNKVDNFVDQLKPGDTAVLYYAGHGFQLEGENYLVPVDFKVISAEVAKQEGYSLSSILERFTSHGATTQIVILDACRDNPFLGTRSVRGGWTGFGTSAGSFLAFGTSPGSTANDDPTDNHGLFTKQLLKYMTSSNQDIEEMFRKVREDVIRASNGSQVPWIASSLIGTYHMRPDLDQNAQSLPQYQATLNRSTSQNKRSIQSTQSSSDSEVNAYQSQISHASTLARGGKIDAAIDILKNILTHNPVSVPVLDLLGLLYHAEGRDVEAISSINTALIANPQDSSAATYKCAVEGIAGDVNATMDCENAVNLNPSFANYLALASVLHTTGNDVESLESVTTSINIRPTDMAYKLRGSIEMEQGRTGPAQDDFIRAARLNAIPSQ